MISPVKSPPDAEVSRSEKLKKIREMLAQKPGFGSKSKSHCPIVRKISDPDKKVKRLSRRARLVTVEILGAEFGQTHSSTAEAGDFQSGGG